MPELYDDYFVLCSTGSALNYKFQVVLGGYQPRLEKDQTLAHTLKGKYDNALGGIYETHTYLIRVRETESRTGYGSLANLKALYKLNTPATAIITMIDHYHQWHQVYMIGTFEGDCLGVSIVGAEAWYHFRCQFAFIPEDA